MAGKSAMPLLLGVGAAALLLTGKKKKKRSDKKVTPVEPMEPVDPPDLDPIEWLDVEHDPEGDQLLAFDAECSAIINKINMVDHDTWLTNRYFDLVAGGMTDLSEVTVQLLMDQSEHCPWSTPESWTPMMKGLYDQLFAAVKGWHSRTDGNPPPG